MDSELPTFDDPWPENEDDLDKARFPRHDVEVPRIQAETALFEALEANAEELGVAEDFGRAAAKEAVDSCYEYLRLRGLSGQV